MLLQLAHVIFTDFDVRGGQSPECPTDFMEIFDGNTMDPSQSLGKYCAQNKIQMGLPQQATSNVILIRFFTDTGNSITRTGWRATTEPDGNQLQNQNFTSFV